MADVIVLKDGSVHTLLEPKDFQWLVEKYMGYDAEKYFRELIERLQDEVGKAQDKEQSDLGSYEASLESNTACFQDILEITNSLVEGIYADRVNKRKLIELVQDIRKQINNQI